MQEQNIYEKIDRQTELLEKIVEQTKKTEKYILIGRILTIIKIILIISPIILGIIYLPPFIRDLVEKYQNALPQNQVPVEKIKGIIQDIVPKK